MKQMLAATALVFVSSTSNAAETPSGAAMVEQQIQTCRLVMEHEGITSGGMRLCMAILFVYSKNPEEDSCRVFVPANADQDDLQRCAAALKAVRQKKNVDDGRK